jgi:hypothetical protein
MIAFCVRWATIIVAQRTQNAIMECGMRHMSGCARQVDSTSASRPSISAAIPKPLRDRLRGPPYPGPWPYPGAGPAGLCS